MSRLFFPLAGLLVGVTLGAAGCIHTHSDVVIHQPKPLVVDVNLSGTLTLVVKDARNDMQYIAGQAPSAQVPGPTDIPTIPIVNIPPNQPPSTQEVQSPGSSLVPTAAAPIIFADVAATPMDKSAILRQMRADYPKVRAMLDHQLVGEAHTGYLVPRANLSAAQAQFVTHENGLRRQLYQTVSAQTGQSLAQVGLSYYVVRLRYLAKGVWVQAENKATGHWVWIHWHG